MFNGQFRHNLDDKGRIILPAKFREKITEGAVITIGFDKCITIYTKVEWERLQNSLVSMPVANKVVRSISRVLNGNASDVEIDKQGRVKIPDYLLTFAGITKECCIVGNNATIDIWDATAWNQVNSDGLDNLEANFEQLYDQMQGRN